MGCLCALVACCVVLEGARHSLGPPRKGKSVTRDREAASKELIIKVSRVHVRGRACTPLPGQGRLTTVKSTSL